MAQAVVRAVGVLMAEVDGVEAKIAVASVN